MYIQETYVNATEHCQYGETDVYEAYTDDRGKLFRSLRKEYGRCTGTVFVDTTDGTKAVGWIFQGRARYTDSKDTYLREVWVTRHTAPPTRTVQYHYHAA